MLIDKESSCYIVYCHPLVGPSPLHQSTASTIMARTLPWLKSGTATTLHPTRPKPAKRQRMLDPQSDSDPDNSVNHRAVAKPKRPAVPAAGKPRMILNT